MKKNKNCLRKCVSLYIITVILIVATSGCGRAAGGKKEVRESFLP